MSSLQPPAAHAACSRRLPCPPGSPSHHHKHVRSSSGPTTPRPQGSVQARQQGSIAKYHHPPPHDSVATISSASPARLHRKILIPTSFSRARRWRIRSSSENNSEKQLRPPCRPLARCRVAVPSDEIPHEPRPLAVGLGVGSEETWALSFDHASQNVKNASCLALQRSTTHHVWPCRGHGRGPTSAACDKAVSSKTARFRTARRTPMQEPRQGGPVSNEVEKDSFIPPSTH